MDRLKERYDNVKAPEPPGKGQNARERGKREVGLGFGETVPWDLGKWSHFQPNVEEDRPRVWPDLQNPVQNPEIVRRKNQIMGKDGSMEDSARVWRLVLQI